MAIKLVKKDGNVDLTTPKVIASAVNSVNGYTGHVQLDYKDVKALPEDTVIPSIEGLASEKYVDNAISAIPKVDLSPYAKKTDLKGLATEKYVDNAVANVKVDLTGYATEEYVDKAVENAGGGISEDDCLAALIETDMLPTIHNGEGKLIKDSNNFVILRY